MNKKGFPLLAIIAIGAVVIGIILIFSLLFGGGGDDPLCASLAEQYPVIESHVVLDFCHDPNDENQADNDIVNYLATTFSNDFSQPKGIAAVKLTCYKYQNWPNTWHVIIQGDYIQETTITECTADQTCVVSEETKTAQCVSGGKPPTPTSCNNNGIIDSGELCDANIAASSGLISANRTNLDVSVKDFCIATVQGCTEANWDENTFVDDKTCALVSNRADLVGDLNCTSSCAFDTNNCTSCGNRNCDTGENNIPMGLINGNAEKETSANCPYDCAPTEK